jgi:hypothetical protein
MQINSGVQHPGLLLGNTVLAPLPNVSADSLGGQFPYKINAAFNQTAPFG